MKWFFPGLLAYHAPPQGISVAGEARLSLLIHSILLCQVHEVGRKDEAKKADVQGGDKLLKKTVKKQTLYLENMNNCSIFQPVIEMQAKLFKLFTALNVNKQTPETLSKGTQAVKKH